MSIHLPARQVSKSKLSMYLRTLCDRELYLSLFSNNPGALEAAGIPAPLKSRPGVQFVTASGTEFEHEQFDRLITALPGHIFHKSAGRAEADLAKALGEVTPPTIILQPQIEPQEFRDFTLGQLGATPAQIALIPKLAGLRPDIILADKRRGIEHEILPDGSRRLVHPSDERIPLCVIDLKNITEANASYSAEVCLYAIFLAGWLHTVGKDFKDRYFVSDRIYLWRHTEMPNFTAVMNTKAGGDVAARLEALMADLNDGVITYLVYMPTVRKFFVEDLPRVIAQGDTHGWDSVDYHVNARCGSCDWLGNRSWLTAADQANFDKHPEAYCFHGADLKDHLSKMPTLSRGASKVLKEGGHAEVKALVGIKPDAGVLREHTLLKKDRGQIGARAEAIVSGTVSKDQQGKVGGLAKSVGAEFDIIVNFDSGSGLLTGIAARATVFAPYGAKFPNAAGEDQSIRFLGEDAFVVPKDNEVAEWAALSSFINALGGWIETANKLYGDNNLGKLRTQICFWEVRQYEELCNAFGRHLLKILDLPTRTQRALAWIFPPEELLEKDEQVCPNIVFIKDVISSSIRVPQTFAVTLLGTAEHYHHPKLSPRKIDSYYVEPLGNGVPRERIFEIWKSATGTVRMFGRDAPLNEAIDRYASALKTHAFALASITAQLRIDLKDCITGKAPELSMSIPTGAASLAYDAKLWDRWAKVSAAVAKTEGLARQIARAETLEASYEAIVLTNLIADLGGGRYEFEVSPDSTESKLDEGDTCALGIVSWPGFSLETAHRLGVGPGGKYDFLPLNRYLCVKIEQFERAHGRITVRFESSWSGFDDVFHAVMSSGLIPIGKEPIYLLEGMPYDSSKDTSEILAEIGDPACAKPAQEALLAMGQTAARKLKAGTGPDTAVARVLWGADKLAKTQVRSDAEAGAIAEFARTANVHELNASQVKAARACAQQQLSVMWGPPGTGKTDTLTAFLHAIVREGKPRKILITGPNYRTVEELAGRVLKNLEADPSASADFFWLYSKSRTPRPVASASKTVTAASITMDTGSPEFGNLAESMGDPTRTTIVSTTAHIVHRLTKAVGQNGAVADEVFDLIVLDESSQIPVTLALHPLAALKAGAQVIVAGDSKQMPPIQQLDPPKGAEHLVDSIQTYLVKRFGIAEQPLLVNYRSNADLVNYAKTLGYPQELEPANPKKDLVQAVAFADVLTGLPAELPVTAAYEELLRPERRVTALIHEDPVSSQANALEAGLVAGLAYVARHAMLAGLDTGDGGDGVAFTEETFFSEGIGIVTPHKAQKALVVRKLLALFPSADPELVYGAVDTVERFQGGERSLIIVSFGVGDTDIIEGEEAFLLQLERTNVAVSRAKAKCIVLMPKSLAYHLPSDQKAAETSIALKSYLEEYCAQRKPVQLTFGGAVRAGEVRWR